MGWRMNSASRRTVSILLAGCFLISLVGRSGIFPETSQRDVHDNTGKIFHKTRKKSHQARTASFFFPFLTPCWCHFFHILKSAHFYKMIFTFSKMIFYQNFFPVISSARPSVKYPACGIIQEWRDIMPRLMERVKCRGDRLLAASLEATTKSSPLPMMLVTHDLFNAVGLGNFMFMAAALLGLAESSERKR